jgi:hypothetical protein
MPCLGLPQPNVHFYDEDIRLPNELNVNTDEEAPTKRQGSEPPSEEEIQEPLLEDFTIRHASIDPSVLTPSTQSPSAPRTELPEESTPLWENPRLAALQLRRQQIIAAQTAAMTTQVQTATTTVPVASTSTPAASGSANLTIYE